MSALPRLDEVHDAMVLHLHDGHASVITTPQAARALGDLCRAAEQRLVEQQRERADRLDREAAVAMNAANLPEVAAWGGGLQGWPPKPTDLPPLLRSCGCARGEHCPDCRGGAA